MPTPFPRGWWQKRTEKEKKEAHTLETYGWQTCYLLREFRTFRGNTTASITKGPVPQLIAINMFLIQCIRLIPRLSTSRYFPIASEGQNPLLLGRRRNVLIRNLAVSEHSNLQVCAFTGCPLYPGLAIRES
jgi:hypothetical protein